MHGGGEACPHLLLFPFIFILVLGWCVGNIELDDYYLRRIAVEMKISVLNVEYRYVSSRVDQHTRSHRIMT